jgi:hypothetical protein
VAKSAMLATARGANPAKSATFFNRAILWVRVIGIEPGVLSAAPGSVPEVSH